MKTTAGILPIRIAVAVGFSVALSLGATGQCQERVPPEVRAVPQEIGSTRQHADDLLHRARQAMKENDLQTAGTLVAKAETLGVRYGALHLGDTPQKARRDLERMLSTKRGSLSGGLLSPILPNKRDAAAVDPFAAHNNLLAQTGNVAAAQGITRLPPVTDASPLMPRNMAGAREAAVPVGGSPAGLVHGDRAASDRLVIEARQALALGDVARANDKLRQAERLNVSYGPLDDTPEKVRSLVSQYADLMREKPQRGQSESFRRQFARVLMEQAEGLMRWQDFDEAERLAVTASRQGAKFSPFEARPELLLDDIEKARGRQRYPVVPVGGQFVLPATGANPGQRASQAIYDPAADPTRNMLATRYQAGADGQMPPAPSDVALPPMTSAPRYESNQGMALFQQGQAALKNHDSVKALDYFRQAAAHKHELDPVTAQRLQDVLQMLSAPTSTARQGSGSSMLDTAAAKQQLLHRQALADLAHQESTVERIRQTDPKAALALLEETREKIAAMGLDPTSRDQLLRRLDRDLDDTQRFIQENRPRIELDERNRRVRDQVERERDLELDLQEKRQVMTEEYNQLIKEQRYAEAEVIAKRVLDLDPTDPFGQQLVLVAKLFRRNIDNAAVRDARERGTWEQLQAVTDSSVGFNDNEPYVHGPIDRWEDITRRRAKWLGEHHRSRSERELEIERKLKTPVLLEFNGAPLSEVLDYLAMLAEVNLYLDPQGLAEEGITSDDPVTINLRDEIALENALALILDEKHLAYVIKNDVLKITSEQLRAGEVYPQTYSVADLVIPIPNFMPSSRMGLAGAYHDALGNVGFGGSPFASASTPMTLVASNDGGMSSGAINPTILAQMTGGGGPMTGSMPGGMAGGFGPGGLGGASAADFDSLIELITTTIQPTTWDTVGGPGSIAQFETNLSLVVSQTQEVHEEIVDLLEQLRRMQDLQVTIEVRFITLNDNFFERIGVDFDFDIDDDIDRPFQVFGQVIDDDDFDPLDGEEPNRNTQDRDHDNGSVTVGMQAPGVFSADLDIPFTQNSFGLAVPQFGGFDATAGAQLGFAILSDIEAFFFISAAQGDRRSNVMQAPKVTLFNGQQAFVSDTSQSPFVISVVPVVGDFAAAQQPVIVVLNEGTFLTVQAVVSSDRRFVRLTVVPYFSSIGEVNEFTFEGEETTTESSAVQGNQNEPNDNSRNARQFTTTRRGTTVQLPTFSFVTVTTTVSVPDGGTVLLGGIKRLSEGRNEFGVPMLNKLPYINRLFKNVGIGRETQSLMMMVTPRIIIQEEEEEKLGILAP